MKKSELLLNPYKEHLKKPYLHWAWTLEINWVLYSADEYITLLEEANETLKDNVEFLHSCLDDRDKSIQYTEEENKRLKAEKDKLYIDYENLSNCNADLIQENKKLKEENEELKKQIELNVKISKWEIVCLWGLWM